MIVVPYTRPFNATAAALDATGRPWVAEWVGGSNYAYHWLLTRLWTRGRTFTVVEHDVVPTSEALDAFDGCPREWCASPYPYMGGMYGGLGCTRFRGSLPTRHPGLMVSVAAMTDPTHPPMHWCRLDAWITEVLGDLGEQRCDSHPPVGHLHGYPSHDCFPSPP